MDALEATSVYPMLLGEEWTAAPCLPSEAHRLGYRTRRTLPNLAAADDPIPRPCELQFAVKCSNGLDLVEGLRGHRASVLSKEHA